MELNVTDVSEWQRNGHQIEQKSQRTGKKREKTVSYTCDKGLINRI
jgi:hypothetical protein